MHTILIIEDEESIRTTLTDRLTMEGFLVQTATNGEEGLRQVKERPPDLILCDIMMPGLDGYEVVRRLQANERTASIPFIFLSAKADPPQVRAGMALGADDYLCKPVSKSDLLAAIRTRLLKGEQQHERLDQAVETARLNTVRKFPRELLTPLTDLLSIGQVLESANPASPVAEVQELGRVIRTSTQRLHRNIRRFLLYAELAVASHHPAAQARLRGTGYIPTMALTTSLAERIALQNSRADDLCLDLREMEVAMDSIHFGELVAQLVDNAFKFSTPGSAVLVHTGVVSTHVGSLLVSDQGRGMTADQVLQMGAFRQFDSEMWAQPGIGLGLALVGQLAALYGGSFTLESDQGNGTKANVCLPQARFGAQANSPPPASLRNNIALILGER